MIKIDLRRGVYVSTHPKGQVQARHDKIYLAFGRNEIELTTPAAHRMGFLLIRKSDEARRENGYIVLTVNVVDVHLLPGEAKRIGAGLLLQSEKADDFQRATRSLSC